jgi:hypothetical protein
MSKNKTNNAELDLADMKKLVYARNGKWTTFVVKSSSLNRPLWSWRKPTPLRAET